MRTAAHGFTNFLRGRDGGTRGNDTLHCTAHGAGRGKDNRLQCVGVKITRILAYRVELPLHETTYKWSGGKSVTVFDSTIVRVETDAGLVGHGEVCPLGPFYLPAYAEGVRAGLRELGPHLLGDDPRELGEAQSPDGRRAQGASVREERHRHRLLGHPRPGDRPAGLRAARRPLRRRRAPLPRDLAGVARRDGGAASPAIAPRATAASSSRSAAIPTSTSSGSAPSRRSCRPGDRLVADANTGWTQHEAMRVVQAVRDVDVYIEQPCLTYEECLARPPAHRSSVRARREHRRPRHAAARPGRPGDGRRQSEDQQARRADEDRSRPATCA